MIYVEVSRHWSIYGRRSVRVSDHIFTSWPFKLSRPASEQQSNARPRSRYFLRRATACTRCCLLMLSSLSGSRRPWRVHVTRDEDTWHVTMSAGELHPRFLLSKRFPVHAAVELQDLATLHRLLSDQLGTEHLAWKNIRAANNPAVFTITERPLLGTLGPNLD